MASLKKIALVIAPEEIGGQITALLRELGLPRAECELLSDPRQLVSRLGNVEYDLLLASQSYHGASGSPWYHALRKLASKSKLILFNEGEEPDEALATAAGRDERFAYIDGKPSAASIGEHVGELIPQKRGSGSGRLVTMDDEHYRACQTIIEELDKNLDAHAIYLVDNMGVVLANTGGDERLAISEIGSLLGGGFSALVEVGSLMGETEAGANLIHRQGQRNDFYAININEQISLVLFVKRVAHTAKLGTVWYYMQNAVKELAPIVVQLLADTPHGLFSERAEEDLNAALDNLLDEKAAGKPVEGPLSFESAIEQGLINVDSESDMLH